MMMFGGKAFLGLAAAVLVAAPTAAHAAEGLNCMAQSYGPEVLTKIAKLSDNFHLSDQGEKGNGDALMEIGVAATYECFDANSWSEDALYFATLYELGRLAEGALRQSGRLTGEQLQLLDQALAKRDRPELWAALERAVVSGLEEKETEVTAKDELVLGGFVIAAGLGSDDATSEKIGELLGAMAMMRYGQREFVALTERD
jgi:hypothetical protein